MYGIYTFIIYIFIHHITLYTYKYIHSAGIYIPDWETPGHVLAAPIDDFLAHFDIWRPLASNPGISRRLASRILAPTHLVTTLAALRLEKLQRSGVQLSERLASLGIMGDPLRAPLYLPVIRAVW